jgi:hypothetical protein
MKKTLTILSSVLFLFLTSFNAKAQDDKVYAKSYLGIIGGVTLPQGAFGQTDYNNNSAGFAHRGSTFGLDAGIYLYKNLGVGITASFQDFGELSFADATNLANGYNASFQTDETQVTGVNRYHSFNLMAGPQYSFLIKKFTIDLRASAGILKSLSTPDISVLFNSTSLEQKSSTGLAFAYGGSAGLRWSFSDNWDLGLRANYVDTQGINISNTGHTDNTGRIVTHQPISELLTTLGITLHL